MLQTDMRWPKSKWQVYSSSFNEPWWLNVDEQMIPIKISMLKLEVVLVTLYGIRR